jgi:type IV pilus assembly protein PilB
MKARKIGDLLQEKGYITQQHLDDALSEQKVSGKRLGELLVEQGAITEDQLIETVSERLSIPKVSIASMVLDPRVVELVPVHIARRYTLIPIFAIGNSLTLAMSDPLNIIAIDEIRYISSLNIQRAVATASEINEAIDKYYSVADSMNQIIGTDEEELPVEAAEINENLVQEANSPIIKLVNLIIKKAVKDKSSDIHFEPEENQMRIRYRIDGVMREEAAPPKSMQNELISRIKIASNLDVSEKRLPQDGRFMISVDGSSIDLRVSTLPTIHGEKVVIRILDRRNLMLSFGQLGFSKRIEDRWNGLIRKPEGLVLISGPTSSGKTSTLYTTLQEVNTIEKNIVTIEDPVEYSLPLIIQIQINEKAGLTFPSVLRSILRQNPDIIMVGEVRDVETARLAIRSSLTGHLVFSTIHTNDAISTLSRLLDMGLEGYVVGSAVKGVLAQRLVRVNCPDCLRSYKPSDVALQTAALADLADEFDFRHGTGCPKCKNTGFKGQTGIFEFLEITPAIADAIANSAPLSRIKNMARSNGYVPLFEMGLEKLTAGTVCLEELLRQTSNIEDYYDPNSDVVVRTEHAYPV